MKIPTTEECMEILKEFKVPKRVIKHSLIVNRISLFLAKELKKEGEDIDIELVNAASLLHDMDKISTLENWRSHGCLSTKWLSQKGYDQVGEVIKKHTIEVLFKSDNVSWEDKIVNYADKRCLEDKIISLKDRINEAKKRYGEFKKEHIDKIFEIERGIFNKIKINPEDLK